MWLTLESLCFLISENFGCPKNISITTTRLKTYISIFQVDAYILRIINLTNSRRGQLPKYNNKKMKYIKSSKQKHINI